MFRFEGTHTPLAVMCYRPSPMELGHALPLLLFAVLILWGIRSTVFQAVGMPVWKLVRGRYWQGREPAVGTP